MAGFQVSTNGRFWVSTEGLGETICPARSSDGFRAGFFWAMRNSHDGVLIAGNEGDCIGDKPGDGEFIIFDANKSDAGTDEARTVFTATPNTVTFPASRGRGFKTSTSTPSTTTATGFSSWTDEVSASRAGSSTMTTLR